MHGRDAHVAVDARQRVPAGRGQDRNMRVIAGSAGGIPLRFSSGDLRPTMDLVRGAIFSALGDLVIGARVLDLFAGSGAYGIEALSRGAAEAVFVDNHRKSIEAIQLNLAKAKLNGQVIREDVFRFLQRCDTPFRLVFADPPYAKRAEDRNFAEELLDCAAVVAAVEPGGIFVLERSPVKGETVSGFWEVTRQKKYGATEVLFCVHKKLRGSDEAARLGSPKSSSDS
jgi:16S rRNA (guanine966-N2)-methyltransferase